MADWLGMFADRLLGAVHENRRSDVIAGVEERLRDDPENGTRAADYRRLRFVAVWHPDQRSG
nr:hypothetical protein [Halobellus ruber]